MSFISFFPADTNKGPHHDLHISDALEGVVDAPVGHLHQNLLDGLAVVFRINKLSGSKLLGRIELCGVDVHTDDPSCPGNLAAHYHGQANSSKAKYGTSRTGLNLIEQTEE